MAKENLETNPDYLPTGYGFPAGIFNSPAKGHKEKIMNYQEWDEPSLMALNHQMEKQMVVVDPAVSQGTISPTDQEVADMAVKMDGYADEAFFAMADTVQLSELRVLWMPKVLSPGKPTRRRGSGPGGSK